MYEMSLDNFLYALQKEYTCAAELVIRKSESWYQKKNIRIKSNVNTDTKKKCHPRQSVAAPANALTHSPVQLRISEFYISLQAWLHKSGSASYLIIDTGHRRRDSNENGFIHMDIYFENHRTGEGSLRMAETTVLRIPPRNAMRLRSERSKIESGMFMRFCDWFLDRRGFRLSLTDRQADRLKKTSRTGA